mmetsp:Transcript_38547/g.103315  ORF Transcript_38547/g.103315 Transcript_38547/m.103315 type:complete len:202 (-) Transcript_38547:670-1275(-)
MPRRLRGVVGERAHASQGDRLRAARPLAGVRPGDLLLQAGHLRGHHALPGGVEVCRREPARHPDLHHGAADRPPVVPVLDWPCCASRLAGVGEHRAHHAVPDVRGGRGDGHRRRQVQRLLAVGLRLEVQGRRHVAGRPVQRQSGERPRQPAVLEVWPSEVRVRHEVRVLPVLLPVGAGRDRGRRGDPRRGHGSLVGIRKGR